MFIGEYNFSVDTKGRIAIPAKFRAMLGKGAVVTRGLDNCLSVYPKTEWTVVAKKLSSLPISQANSRAFSRLMLAGAMAVEFDGQGRIVLPEYLRQYAAIGKKVVIAGLFNRLEVWAEDKWAAYRGQTEKDGNSIAEQLGELGI
ncbi:cell division/cell wall cluster transcriptional repressor MraZ [Candidatus Falkowbacteria bacterium RIFOXYC2_FULL_48_21]|uniref:Transcriptional regulator MraZ n=1 Tax=Candidatus Falkowbacteria bacterium RIFOXYC2_FULL_48_21 TaxID=1798005 RepID=A0A1F5TEZ1_9BACT|nr:MAG: cell division/cell wall cluster transcriptional repressor MraZ [Candidatus Falkowbacteria bacterium RIFOXYC2_FULL_48_21]